MLNLRPHLDRLRMTQTELAEAIGITRSYMSLLVTGKREPSPAMLQKLATSLKVEVRDLFDSDLAPTGMSDEATPYQPGESAKASWQAVLAPETPSRALYLTNYDEVAFGIMSGDVLTVDLRKPPKNGDLVLATEALADGGGTTIIRQLQDPWLLPATLGKPAALMDESGQFAIMGVIVGVARDLSR